MSHEERRERRTHRRRCLVSSSVMQEDRLTCGGESFRQVIWSVLVRMNLDCEAGFIFISVINHWF